MALLYAWSRSLLADHLSSGSKKILAFGGASEQLIEIVLPIDETN